MAVYRGSLPQDRFTSIANDWVRDPEMKLSQRGLLVYIASHKQGYKLTVTQMIAECADGRDAVYSALKGLKELGYLRMLKHRGVRGRISEIDYELVDPHDPTDEAAGTAEGIGDPATSGNSGSGTTSGFSGSGAAGSGQTGSGQSATKKTSSKKTSSKKTTTTPLPPDGDQASLVDGHGSTVGKPTARTRRRKPVSFMTEDWLPPVDWADKLAAELGCTREQLATWLSEFRLYWIGQGEAKADWVAVWRNRMRTRFERGEVPGQTARQSAAGRPVDPAADVLRKGRERRNAARQADGVKALFDGDVVMGQVV